MDPDFLQRYHQACARVQTRRINHELELMAREEADDTHQFHAAIGGVSYGPFKEANSAAAATLRSNKPSTYKVKDEKEWRSFINWWKIVFKKNPDVWFKSERIACTAVEF